MKSLVLFDFDGTLYEKDSLIEFTKFYKGKVFFFLGIIKLLPCLIMFKLNLISNEDAKKIYMKYFFKNEEYSFFVNKANDFALFKIDKSLNFEKVQYLNYHLNENHDIYIVTASFQEWILAWAEKYNIKVIGTKMEHINNIVTGNFISKNCYGIEKVNRIKLEINIDKYKDIYVYGKGIGDKEMLMLSNKTLSKVKA